MDILAHSTATRPMTTSTRTYDIADDRASGHLSQLHGHAADDYQYKDPDIPNEDFL